MAGPIRTVHSGAVIAALCAADFLVALDGLIVAVALPPIGEDLGLSTASLQWVINAYVLCFGGFLLLGGRLGDLFGSRRVLLGGLALFAAGALMSGTASGAPGMVGGRALQGLGAAFMAAAALALLIALFPEKRARRRALGWWSAAGSLGIPAGALLGGALTTTPGWRWVLLVNVPAALVAAAATLIAVPERRDPDGPRRLDARGAVLATAGVTLLVAGILQLEHAGPARGWAMVLVPVGTGVLLLALFARAERRHPSPLLPPSVLRTPGLLRTSVVGAALPVGLGAALFIGTLALQRVLGFSALQTGLAYLALALPVVTASPLASVLTGRFGGRAVACGGFLLQAAGLLLLARMSAGSSFPTGVLPGLVLVGLGAPIAFVPTTEAALGGREASTGLLSGIFTTAQQVGNALALAAMAATSVVLTAERLRDGGGTTEGLLAGYSGALLVAAALATTAAVLSLRLPRSGR